ncbi:7861_t:CDS:1 [Paraglomus occultum]|uniref:Phosphatidylglycerol/phosphatidylinositol transfer protein n=1 Tax=Paraglomus occultum TaxID=144539 RepID=A0A9N9C8G0_9GLOM|nr:7861_t:CDS:1 [Paraglomus occultum]
MKHPIFALFFALVTTSVINAIPHGLSKRATQFQQCSALIPPLDVSLSSDSIVSDQDVTFTVSGNATTDITEATFGIYFYDDETGFEQSFKDNLCNVYKSCPIKKGAAFDFQVTIKPVNLPTAYFIDVYMFKDNIGFHCARNYTYSDQPPLSE